MKSRKEENTTSTKEAQKSPRGWDYNKIREVREAEDSQRPSEAQIKKMNEADANCTVMNREQMIRSKAQGCRPLDERAGLGVDSYCCPRDMAE